MDREELMERVAKLQGGLVVVQPGGRTQVEVEECRDRIEDALCAVKASLEEGFVTGGGAALLHA